MKAHPGTIAALVIGAALLAGCGGSSTPSGTSPAQASPTTTGASPTSGPTGSASPSSAGPIASRSASPPVTVTRLTGLQQFQSPTGNIGCVIDKTMARCDIAQRDWTPPSPPPTCQLDYGQGVDVYKGSKGSLTCAGDTALDPHAEKLAYNHAVQVAAFRCTSEASGMTCENRLTGHGFVLSRQSYRVY